MIKDNTKLKDVIYMNTGKGITDNLNINVNCIIELFDPNSRIKDKREIHNTVTTAGKNGVADQILASPTLAKMGWMAIGSGTPTGTLLGAEPGTLTGTTRVAFTSKTRNNAVVTVVGDFSAGNGTGAITEAGTFNIATSNTVDMWMSASFSVINKGALDTLQITWTLTVS